MNSAEGLSTTLGAGAPESTLRAPCQSPPAPFMRAPSAIPAQPQTLLVVDASRRGRQAPCALCSDRPRTLHGLPTQHFMNSAEELSPTAEVDSNTFGHGLDG